MQKITIDRTNLYNAIKHDDEMDPVWDVNVYAVGKAFRLVGQYYKEAMEIKYNKNGQKQDSTGHHYMIDAIGIVSLSTPELLKFKIINPMEFNYGRCIEGRVVEVSITIQEGWIAPNRLLMIPMWKPDLPSVPGGVE